jgi:tetratricopeptide (TPR) repeat protein
MKPASRPTPSFSRLNLVLLLTLLTALPMCAMAQADSAGTEPRSKQEQAAAAALAGAQEAIERQDYATAATILESFLFEHPGHVGALFNLAYCYSLQKRTADAITLYRQTLEVDPKLAAAHFNLALLLLDEDKLTEAAAALERVIELEPDRYDAHYYHAATLERLGRKQQARAHYRRAAELDPAQPAPRRALLSLLLEEDDLEGAQTVLHDLLKLAPEDANLLRLRADLLHRQDKTDEALAAYESYLKVEPKDADAHLAVGRLYRQQGKLEEALRHFTAAAEQGQAEQGEADSEWASTYERARTLAALERYAEAIPLYRRTLELMGDDVDREVYAELGHALLQSKQYAEAVPALAAALRADPTQEKAYNQLASALFLSGNLAATIAVLDRRAEHATETPGTLYLRAVSYDKLQQCGAAVKFYQEFLAQDPDTRSDQYFQGTARLRFLKKTCRESRR